jgi:hypothetical protein
MRIIAAIVENLMFWWFFRTNGSQGPQLYVSASVRLIETRDKIRNVQKAPSRNLGEIGPTGFEIL